MTIIFDTCIILDYLLNRKEFIEASENIIFKAVNQDITGLLTVKSIMDIHYFLRKTLHDERKTREIISTILDSFILIDSNAADAIKALNSEIKDYEDALTVETASSNEIDAIVTRDLNDFKGSKIQVISPETLVSMTD